MSVVGTDVKPVQSFPDLGLVDVDVSRGRHLPRWEAACATYHVTFHLADSVPQEQLGIWRAERDRLKAIARQANRELTEQEITEMKEVFNVRVERYLASGYGDCVLKNAEVAELLAGVLEHSNGKLYSLHEYCIMPNHVHMIVGGFSAASPLNNVLTVWKRASGHAINKALARAGDVWHRDTYTRIIRDEREYAGQLRYVWFNPETAGITTGFLRRRYVP